MKRIASALLAGGLLLSLAACGGTSSEPPAPTAAPTAAPAAATEAPSAAPVEVPEGFVLISGGSFAMGSPDAEAWRSADETQHTVTVSDFYISPYEVTQQEYAAARPHLWRGAQLFRR